MDELKTTAIKREIMNWSPYVRLVHNYADVGRGCKHMIEKDCINDHALHYFHKGYGEYSLDGKIYRIEPESVFIVRPGHGYSLTLDGDSSQHMLNIHFDLIEQNNSFHPHPYPDSAKVQPINCLPEDFGSKVRVINYKKFEKTFFDLHLVFLLQGTRWELKKKSLMLDLLGIIHDNSSSIASPPPAEHRRSIQKSLEYIHRNIEHKITLDGLIKHAGMCRALFVKVFKAECGLSPVKFVYKIKIEKAKNDLASGRTSIKQVAESLGFADVYHFSRIFKEFTGMPPGQYQKMYF